MLVEASMQRSTVCTLGASKVSCVPWHVAPVGRILATVSSEDEESLMERLFCNHSSTGTSDVAWELLVLVQSGDGTLSLVPCPTQCESMMDIVREVALRCSEDAKIIRGIAVPRCRGGKGGFGKNLAKKGRLYIKAQRRGETNANLNQLGRNLRGERIGGTQDATRTNTPGNNDEHSNAERSRQLPHDVEAAYAEVMREHEHKKHEREAFSVVIREAVMEGFRVSVDEYLKALPPPAPQPAP